jgi:hypothetical protein
MKMLFLVVDKFRYRSVKELNDSAAAQYAARREFYYHNINTAPRLPLDRVKWKAWAIWLS